LLSGLLELLVAAVVAALTVLLALVQKLNSAEEMEMMPGVAAVPQ
jgi:hypothetical protein